MKTFFTHTLAIASLLSGTTLSVSPAQAASFSWGQWTSPSSLQVKSKTTDQTGFQALMPEFQKFVQLENQVLNNPETYAVDPTKLTLTVDSAVRVYFLNEGASYKNQLAYDGTTSSSYQAKLIFNNVSAYDSLKPNPEGPLTIGDYVDLGVMQGGTKLNFWIRTNGYNGGANVYGSSATLNPDQLEHMVSYVYKDYLILGFEDLYGPKGLFGGKNEGSDRDFNDVLFVVDIGKTNILNLTVLPQSALKQSVPEATLGSFGWGAIGLLLFKKQRKPVNKV
ncbi:hypothetical protein BST81_20855 [Leptolyngbya sp. 'hensonii']|uniref:DUF4114 domain-containing protein n=1 Tax=Leptolyngbya sp. 'hensonii' TaxID=1922337 RepID=UPI00094FC939|nr:DUF4114 domain-containing protein [Leptolyngbya sp. 'hensonii']OLP16434.1 hypothetical protein BST81_20855 [Leptolyngbya sp. 'hensonii']